MARERLHGGIQPNLEWCCIDLNAVGGCCAVGWVQD